jgi:hypothetical protein
MEDIGSYLSRPPPVMSVFDPLLIRLFEFALESPLSPDLPPPNHVAANAKLSAAANWGRGDTTQTVELAN